MEARLEALDRTTQALDLRLHALEAQLTAAGTTPETSAIALGAAAAQSAVPAATIAPPPTAAMPPSSEMVPLLDFAQALLDGPPSSSRRGQALSPVPASRPEPSLVAPWRTRVARQSSLSLDDLERAISGRGLAWTGGLALLLGALFFLSLAISRGWIGVEARVVIGLVAGIGLTALGDRLLRGEDRLLGPVLVAVGIGVWNLALVAGTRLYDLIPLWPALLGAGAGAVVATAIAVRANAQVIALYGIVTALAAPLLFAVPAAQTPMVYLLVMLAGSTAIAVARGWSWLPPVAFVLSEVQFFLWWQAATVSERDILLVIAGFSLLHLLAATGVALRASTPNARSSAIILLALNAAVFAGVSHTTLADHRIVEGLAFLAAAAAYGACGIYVLRRQRGMTEFISAAFAIAVILLTAAPPMLFIASPVAIAWAAEAVGLIWLAHRYGNPAGYRAAAAVFGLAIWHLFGLEYGPGHPVTMSQGHGLPFVNAAGLTLAALLGLLVVAGAIVREPLARITFAVIGFGLVIAALPQEVSHLALLAGWSLLAVLALGSERLLVPPVAALPLDRNQRLLAAYGLKIVAAVAAMLAVVRGVVYEMPVLTPSPFEAGAAYLGQPVAAAAILVLAALGAALVTRSSTVRQITISLALLVVAHLAAFRLDLGLAVAIWSALAVVAWWLCHRARGVSVIYLVTAAILLATGLVTTLTMLAPPARLLVTASSAIDHVFLWSEAALALGALMAALFVIAGRMRGTHAGGWLALGGGVLALYLVSVGIVDEFQRRVGDVATVAELRWQSQVALSVVWAILGGLAVAVGLLREAALLRWFGLGLLALATGKVFLYDLASLDPVYRVLSFIVLGIFLLLSAYAYRRLGGTRAGDRLPPDATRSHGGRGHAQPLERPVQQPSEEFQQPA
jgi:uncharacterized membrane protein